jgi:alpha-D-xyloside xylohydrolase
MEIIDYKIEGNSIYLKLKQGLLLLKSCGNGIIRCVYTKKTRITDFSALQISSQDDSTPAWSVKETPEQFSFQNGSLLLLIKRDSGHFMWMDSNTKELLLQEGDKELSVEPVNKYSLKGEKAIIKRVKTVDGERNFVENMVSYHDRDAYRAKIFFKWQKDEAIHGLGQSEEGNYNRRGTTQYLYQHNMKIPVPFLISDKNYGILFDCGSLMTFNDDAYGSYVFLDTVEQLDYYFIYGKQLDDVIAGFRKLTGQAVMLPKWAFGYVQSKEAYQNQQELVDVVAEYRKREVPLDCVVQDWNTWKDNMWGDKHLDPARYPDIVSAVGEIHKMHAHTMISIWPNMNEGGKDFEEFASSNYLLLDNSTYDAFNKDARKMYWKQIEEELLTDGFDSWWCDSTEPFSGPDWNGEVKREPWERFQLVGGEHKKYLDPALANLYAKVHAQGIYENQRISVPGHRVLNLTRSGSAGSQKYGTVLWSGDISATWETLRKQIVEGLNFCMSGMPYWTLDIGGFFVVKEAWQKRGCGSNRNPNPLWFWNGGFNNGVDDFGYRELYVRWIEYGTFLPMFRSHGTDTPREIWNFGQPGDVFYDAIKKFICLRYRLMPYIYSMAGRVSNNNYTIMRSLLFDFPYDSVAKQIDNEFMFGEALLVCPVIEPMYYEANNRRIVKDKTRICYLPSGVDWFDFWTGKLYRGGQTIIAEAPLDRIPLFVKAGSIIPMESSVLQYAQQTSDTPLEFHVYPSSDGQTIFYEDSGDGYEYEKGKYNQIPLCWDDKKQIFSIGKSNYRFPQSASGRLCSVVVDGESVDFQYTGEPMFIEVKRNR